MSLLVTVRRDVFLFSDGALILAEPGASGARIAELAVMVMLMNRADSRADGK